MPIFVFLALFKRFEFQFGNNCKGAALERNVFSSFPCSVRLMLQNSLFQIQEHKTRKRQG